MPRLHVNGSEGLKAALAHHSAIGPLWAMRANSASRVGAKRLIDTRLYLGETSSRLIRPAGCTLTGTVNVSGRLSWLPLTGASGSETQPPDVPGSLYSKEEVMRDFRDAKAMAHTLRSSLSAKAVNISHSESLALVSKMFGVADWNTLSAEIESGGQKLSVRSDAPMNRAVRRFFAIPMRDLVPFPGATYRCSPAARKPFMH